VPEDAVGEDREARDDLRLLADEVAHRQVRLDVRPRFVLDPLAALDTISAGLHELLRRSDSPHEEQCRRLDAATARARRVPHLLEQAGTLLASSPSPHLEVALRRLPAIVTLVRDELPRRAEALGTDVSPARDAGEVAAEGLEAYGALLTSSRRSLPPTGGSGPTTTRCCADWCWARRWTWTRSSGGHGPGCSTSAPRWAS
jgi:hypothetical protein